MELQTSTSPLLPGQRLLSVDGDDYADKYPMPRDCEAALFHKTEKYFYVKKTDVNGGVILNRYRYEEDPIPRFDPKKYVTVDDFKSFKEEILNGFNSLQQTITAANANGSNGNGFSKSGQQPRKSNNGVGQSSANVQSDAVQ